MNTKKVVAIHFICWIIFLGYYYLDYIIGEKRDLMSLHFQITIDIVHIVEFYICYLWVYPFYLKKSKIPQLIGGLVVAMGVFIGLRYLLEEILNPYFFGFRNYNENTTLSYYIMDNLYFGTPYIVVAAAIWNRENALKAERLNQQLRKEVEKAELSFLRSQLNPHFLYNTLNYMFSLALPVSEKLATAVLKLSDLMRYTLTESPDGKVSLAKELAYLQSYTELFRMRFEPAFYADFEVEGILEQQRVAALLLIPLVENAFKHGITNDPEHPVKIAVSADGKYLNVVVQNKVNNYQKDYSSGIGLANVKRRLYLLYPDKYELDVDNNGLKYEVRLRIEL